MAPSILLLKVLDTLFSAVVLLRYIYSLRHSLDRSPPLSILLSRVTNNLFYLNYLYNYIFCPAFVLLQIACAMTSNNWELNNALKDGVVNFLLRNLFFETVSNKKYKLFQLPENANILCVSLSNEQMTVENKKCVWMFQWCWSTSTKVKEYKRDQ